MIDVAGRATRALHRFMTNDMTNDDDNERPQKRRFVENGDRDSLLRALLLEEIDLEIGLRNRLKEIVESRLTWALALEDALERHFESHEIQHENDSPNQFADLAKAAYDTTRDHSRLFLSGEPHEPISFLENSASVLKLPVPCNAAVKEAPRARPWARPHVQLHHEDRIVKEPNKYLFIKDVTATPMMVYRIACPDCGRSDFPRLQGLLNHCRLKHHREFGTHDECVQACAVVVPEEEQELIIKRGLEVTGMSASLQRLFKMAVGSYEGIVSVPAEEAEELAKVVRSHPHSEAEGVEQEASTLVTKTLGHHKDTPALAPFLGRAPKKRQIHVFDEDSPLDVVSICDNGETAAQSWKMPYSQRSRISGTTEDTPPSEGDEPQSSSNAVGDIRGGLNGHGGSRFHIPVRLIISDHSLRLSEAAAKKLGGTHKWMISITTASYSLHASTVLVKATVTCATESPPSTFIVPLSVSEPPFCVMGTSDRSFLARITLEWAAASRNKPTQIDHWIELEMGKSSRPVKGDDQVIDIELDRHTELLPRKEDSRRIEWSTCTDSVAALDDQKAKMSETSGGAEPDHIKHLKILIQRFPLTAQDADTRKLPRVPYFLPLTNHHFESLVEGRRKAIEWARTRAIYEAYAASGSEKDAAGQDNDSRDSMENFSGPMALYRWMVTEGYFPRATSQSPATAKPHATLDLHCAFCGFKLSVHRRGKSERAKDVEGASVRACELPSWISKMPIVDARDFCAQHTPAVKRRPPAGQLSEDAHNRLLQLIDPALTVGVQRLVSALQLSCFSAPPNPRVYGIVPTREQLQRELVPYAVLAASVRTLIRWIVNGSLQAIDTKIEGSAKPAVAGSVGPRKRLLVPAHVVRGLVEGIRRRGSKEVHYALLLSMARLGVAVDDAPSQTTPQIIDSAPDQNEARASETKK